MSLLQMRVWCLQLAAQRAEEDATTEELVTAAETFFTFLACKEHQSDKPKLLQ